jgi:hypothetical protein
MVQLQQMVEPIYSSITELEDGPKARGYDSTLTQQKYVPSPKQGQVTRNDAPFRSEDCQRNVIRF